MFLKRFVKTQYFNILFEIRIAFYVSLWTIPVYNIRKLLCKYQHFCCKGYIYWEEIEGILVCIFFVLLIVSLFMRAVPFIDRHLKMICVLYSLNWLLQENKNTSSRRRLSNNNDDAHKWRANFDQTSHLNEVNKWTMKSISWIFIYSRLPVYE